MSDKIHINLDSVQAILKKLQIAEEEIRIVISQADKAISTAELEGFNDKRYYELKDSFEDTKSTMYYALKKIEEEHIPYLRRILRLGEDFNDS